MDDEMLIKLKLVPEGFSEINSSAQKSADTFKTMLSTVADQAQATYAKIFNTDAATKSAKDSGEVYKQMFKEQEAAAKQTQAADMQALSTKQQLKAITMQVSTEISNAAKLEIASNKQLMESKKSVMESVKELGKQASIDIQLKKQQADAEKAFQEIQAKTVSGQMSLADAAKKHMQVAEQQYSTMQKLRQEIKESGDADGKLAEQLKKSEEMYKKNLTAASNYKNDLGDLKVALKQMADADSDLERIQQKVNDGTLKYSDAVGKLQQNAKLAYQELRGLQDQQKAGVTMTSDQIARMKELGKAIKDNADAALVYEKKNAQMNQAIRSTEEKMLSGAKAVASFGAGLTSLASSFGKDNIFGQLAGGVSMATNNVNQMFTAISEGRKKGGLEGALAIGGGVMQGIQTVVQLWNMADAAVRKYEQGIIDAGKKATETSNQFKSYALGNKTLEDRIKLIDEVAKSDQKMASSLRGLASDSEAFDAKLKQVNKSLLETREKGMGKEWEVEQTGGGLFGWMKKIGTATEEMAANMGKARVAIDEFRAGVSETGKDLQTAMDASASYQGGVEDRIRSMQIAIENAKGNIARVRELEIEGLEREKETTKKLINDKLELIKIRQIDAKIQAAQVNTQILNQQKIINNMTDFRNDDSTQSIINSTFGKSEKELQSFMTKFREIIDTNVKYYDDQEELVSETIAELTHTFGKQFTQAANMADLSVKEFFTNLVKGDADVKNYITSMRELIPAQEELKNGANLYKNAIKDLQDQLDPKNENSIERALDRLIAKQRELWAVEDAKNNKPKPGAKPEIPKPTAIVDNYNFKDILANLDAIEKKVNGFTIPMIEEMKLTLAKRLYELTKTPDEQGKYSEEIIKISKVMTLLQGQFDSVEKQLLDMKAGVIDSFTTADTRLKRMMMGWTGEAIPDANAKLKALDAQVDQQIDAIEEYYAAQGKLGDQQLKYFEKMRDDMKEVNRQTVAYEGTLERAAEEQKKLNEETAKTNEMWSNLSKTVDDASKIHLDWLKTFDPKGYEQAMAATAKATLEAQINGIKGMRDALEKEMIATGDSEAFRNKVKEATKGMLVLTGDKKADWEALWKYFNMTAKEAADLAGYVIDANGNLTKLVATAKEGAIALSGFAAQLKEAGEKANELFNWKPTFDLQGFLTDYDRAIKGIQSNVLETITDRFNSDMKGLNDTLDKSIKDANKTFNDWLSDREKGMTDAQKKEFEMSDEYFAKLQETNNKIVELTQGTADKRLAIMQKNALDLANAYKSELDKLEQMQKSFDDRIKSREKMTGDARVEVANYVSRSKMSKAQQEADDIAKSIADQYQKYLAAGMSELELTEWLALKKKETLTGKDAETTKWFEKQWAERSKAAIESARIEKELYDAETKRMQDALDKQKELVDNLKGLADKAKNSLIAMLEQLGITAAGIIDATPKAGDATGEATQKGSSLGSRSEGVTLTDGMRYSQVKGRLSDSQKPSQELIAFIGKNGVTDLIWKASTKQWVTYPSQYAGNNPVTGSEPAKTETAPTPKTEAVPLETSVEIQARIDNYNKLGETAKKVITDIKGFVKDYDTAMQESFKLLQPTMQEQWVKDVVASIAKLSKALVDAFKQPFIDEFDPINGKGLVKVITEWGHSLISYYGIGIESGIENLKKSILKTLAEAIQPYLETHSPPEKGALHNIDIWGYQTGQLYTQSFGQGITDGNIYVNDGLTKTADTVQKVNKKIAYEYSPKNLGMATMIGTTDLTALKDVLKQLTADPLVKGMWSAREQEYASSDKEFGAFSKALDLQVNKAEIEKQNSILNITDTAAKVEQFYKQFNKGLLSPDMGDISEELVRKQIQDQPYLSTFYWYGKQLQQQYPEIYKNLVADGTIIPSSTGEIKNKAGEVIGRTQTGSYRDRYSVDYQEQDYAGATGFNDWLQSKFNDWLVKNQNMVDPDTGKTIQSSGYNPTLARDKFLGGWSDERLADIMTEYQNYVKGLGTVKSVQDYEKAIMENYAGTSIANALATGQDMDKTLVNSDWGNTLLTNKQKAKYQDKTIKTGVGIYDSKGVRQEGLEVLAGMNTAKGGVGSGGLGSAGKVAALIKANGSYVITSKNNTIIFTIPRGDTLPPQDFDYDELGINDIMKLFEVDYETAEDMWKKNRHFKINFAGAKTQGLMGGMSGFAASGDVTKLPEGYTIKDIFTTIKGDYAGGVDALAQMAGNLDSDKRKLILDNLVARIDEQYPNTTTTKDQSEVGGGVVSGDYIKVDATETRDYTAVRAGLKDQVARMLGFDKEFSVARGWRNALGADVENTANEEILKWIELTSDEIRKQTKATIDDPVVESENYQKTREYLQELVADKGVTPELLKDFQTALNAAMQLGYIDKSEAAKLVSTLLPSGVDIKEQVGLTTFRGGTKEIEGFSWIDALLQSPWGGQSSIPYGQEGMRQFLEKYTDLAPVVTSKTGDYSNKYKITDNAFKYYERATKGWQPGFSWTDLNAPIQVPATEPELIPYTGETPTAYGGGYPVMPGFVGGFGSYMDYGGGNYTLPPSPSINMGTGNRLSTFSSGSGNTFYFSVNIAKMDVADGTDFGDQFIEAITDKMKNIGVTI